MLYKLLFLATLSAASGFTAAPRAIIRTTNLRAAAISMADPDATRDASPQSFDNDMSGWKPPGGGGGDAHGGSGFSSTDTPDFAPEEGSEEAALAAGVGFTDGMGGSQIQNQGSKQKGPELEGALDSDPDIYTYEQAEINVDTSDFVLPEPSFKVSKMEVSATDDEFEFVTDQATARSIVIEVPPVCMTFEEFYCGFTADSHGSFSCTPQKGRTERRNGPPTEIEVTCDPTRVNCSGEVVGHLCFILPEEKDFSTYYKVTCKVL